MPWVMPGKYVKGVMRGRGCSKIINLTICVKLTGVDPAKVVLGEQLSGVLFFQRSESSFATASVKPRFLVETLADLTFN